MLYKGHLAVGVIMASTAAIISSPDEKTMMISVPIAGICSIFTSLIPDLDSKTSKISKKIPIVPFLQFISILGMLYAFSFIIDFENKKIIYEYLNKFILYFFTCGFVFISLSHRKLLHSLIFLFVIILIVNKYIGFESLYPQSVSMGLIMGLSSHLIGDCMTVDACPLLYPLPWKIGLKIFKSGKDDFKIVSIILIICIIIICQKYDFFNFLLTKT